VNQEKKLFLFTTDFPDGWYEQFIEVEIKYLCKYFDKVVIVPCVPLFTAPNKRELPQNATKLDTFEKTFFRKLKVLLKSLFSFSVYRLFFNDIFDRKLLCKPSYIKKCFKSSLFSKVLFERSAFQEILKQDLSSSVFYFYWGNGWSYVIPQLYKYKFLPKIVKFHGYDLYEEDYDGYLPHRRELLKNLTAAIFVSQDGLDYQKNKFNDINFEAKFFPLGVLDMGINSSSKDNIFRILSVAFIDPVKRLHLLVEALKYIDFELEWTHIGGGSVENKIKELSASLPSNVRTNFLGNAPSKEVIKYYKSNPVDLFINTSETEAINVSVQEAVSFGVPIIAPAVGGLPEIVDNSMGYLLDKNFKPQDLANKIKEYYLSTEDFKQEIRQNARKKWENKFNSEKNHTELAHYLLSLIK